MSKTNFLRETIDSIRESEHAPEDIIFIGIEATGQRCSWEEFQALADFEYNAGYGTNIIHGDLIIVFVDGQKMWRGEYDGAEWWEVSKPFVDPGISLPLTNFRASGLDY